MIKDDVKKKKKKKTVQKLSPPLRLWLGISFPHKRRLKVHCWAGNKRGAMGQKRIHVYRV